MSKRFFRTDMSKKTAALTDEELRDKLLSEDMERVAHRRQTAAASARAWEGNHTGNDASAPVGVSAAPTLLSKKTAAVLRDLGVDAKRIREEVKTEIDAATDHEQKCAGKINDLVSNIQPSTAPVRPKALSSQDGIRAGTPSRPALTKTMKLYADQDVCRLLGIKRRVLARTRIKLTRGHDWDCIGMHAGMTDGWIMGKLLEQGKPVTDIGSIKPIEPDDGVISCRVVGSWPNLQRVTVELVADGTKEVAWVKDSRLLHLNEIFNCRRFAGNLSWQADINNCVY